MNRQQLQTPPRTAVGSINIVVHGHFYQPPREDLFTGIVPLESGAAPFANYNEKITAECYRPNAELGNFDLMSFNLGPTLASWLEKAHPDVYRRIIEADRLSHTALAQGYNHAILPLLSRRDKQTQVLWGIQDFRHRYGREPKGMWCPETAVDLETLDVMAECGIQFTILAPEQVKGPLDPTEPYRVRLREGRTITVFIYNNLSGPLSYDDDRTTDANQFAASYQVAYINWDKAAAGVPQITLIATDGELYGHHKRFRDRFLSHFLEHSASAYGFTVSTLEAYLAAHPATAEVTILEPSSWSCGHGVARWSVGCACTEGNASWKPHLRHALIQLAERGDALFEQHGWKVLNDPWLARDGYITLRNGWEAPEHFWQRHARCSDSGSILIARDLLEAQYGLQCSFTSCGWFFEDLDRIEPYNDIAFARYAISRIYQATGHDLQRDFIRDLALARSWRTGLSGADLYRSLPFVPKSLLPEVQP